MDLTFGIFCAIVPCVRYLALAAVYSIPSNRSTSPPLLRALDELGVKIPTPRFLPPTRQLATSPFSPFAAPDPCNSFLFTSFADPSNYLLSFHIFPKKHPGGGGQPPFLYFLYVRRYSLLTTPLLRPCKSPSNSFPSLPRGSQRTGHGTRTIRYFPSHQSATLSFRGTP